MDVICVKENEDGSAVYTFDLNEEEQTAMVRLGIITAIKNSLEEAKEYSPEYKENE